MNHRDPEAQRIQESKTALCYSLAFRLSRFAEDYWQNPTAYVRRYIKADPSARKPLGMTKTKRVYGTTEWRGLIRTSSERASRQIVSREIKTHLNLDDSF